MLGDRRYGKTSDSPSPLCFLLTLPPLTSFILPSIFPPFLSLRNYVSAVISNDSDALLYGAPVLIKNFTVANSQSSDLLVYSAASLSALHDSRQVPLPRRSLVAYALLAGSDEAGGGVASVGGARALAFLSTLLPSEDPIEVLRDLASSTDAAPTGRLCSICRHPGDKVAHASSGCTSCGTCGTSAGCEPPSSSSVLRGKLAEKLRLLPGFPSKKVVDKYLGADWGGPVDQWAKKTEGKVSVSFLTTNMLACLPKHNYLSSFLPANTFPFFLTFLF